MWLPIAHGSSAKQGAAAVGGALAARLEAPESEDPLEAGGRWLRLLEERRFSVQPSSTDAGNALTSRPRFLASAVTMLSCQSNAALRQ